MPPPVAAVVQRGYDAGVSGATLGDILGTALKRKGEENEKEDE